MSNYKFIILFTLTFLFSYVPPTIEGIVLDEYDNPIKQVFVSNDIDQCYTDDNGNFIISYDTKIKKVNFKKIGYQNLNFEINPQKPFLTIILKKQHVKLKEVIISEFSGKVKHQNISNDIQTLTDYDFNPGDIHFENIVTKIPNINYAGGTSRPRFFQIRGIGERSQYAGEGGPNYYVGTVLDNIDLSGIGMPIFLDDVSQIEVYQGPQSYAYGYNAMAGLINIITKDPSNETNNSLKISLGNDNLKKISYLHQFKPFLNDKIYSNFFIFNSRQDGFMYNKFFNDYKNDKFEELQKLKLTYLPSSLFSSRLTIVNSNMENGYDVWSPNNNIDTTYSNQPGMDSQKLRAISIKNEINQNQFSLVHISNYLDSQMEHSYDSDWGNDEFWSEDPYNVDYWSYEYYQQELRRRYMSSHEIRIINSFGLLNNAFGYYYKDLREEDNANGWILGGEDVALNSIFNITNHAIFNELKYKKNNITLSLNGRIEQVNLRYNSIHYHEEYIDYDYYNPIYDTTYVNTDYHDNLKAGKFSINYQYNNKTNIYFSISDGYKAGGVNQNPRLSIENRLFKPEFNRNYDFGYKHRNKNFAINFNYFYMLRKDLQVSLSSQQDSENPNSFFFYTSNASDGYNYGLTMNLTHIYDDSFESYLNIGYLKTQINSYSYLTDSNTEIIFEDREAAHAPSYTLSWGFEKYYNAINFGAELTAKDKFYFSDSHNEQSDPYTLVNLHIGYQYNNQLNMSIWAKNVFNQNYAIRGFYFGLEPPTYSDKLYISYGEPFTIGLSLDYNF